MAENALKSQKRILTDATMTSGNLLPNNTPKKRKLDVDEPSTRLNVPPRSSAPKSFGSSQMQQKSRFEEDLEKLTQDINGLKDSNAEKDQQWDRPPLGDFDPAKDNLCFQQIDVEEGESNGRTAVKLFGVTEVCSLWTPAGII
jgi:DNA polymerase delta subunit 1